MTRAHAARQLLKHGPLTLREFVEITGWNRHHARHVVNNLRKQREVRVSGVVGKQVYRIVQC